MMLLFNYLLIKKIKLLWEQPEQLEEHLWPGWEPWLSTHLSPGFRLQDPEAHSSFPLRCSVGISNFTFYSGACHLCSLLLNWQPLPSSPNGTTDHPVGQAKTWRSYLSFIHPLMCPFSHIQPISKSCNSTSKIYPNPATSHLSAADMLSQDTMIPT